MNRDEILSDLLVGELDEASDAVVDAFVRDPDLAAEWREMKSIQALLEAGAEFEREVVEESAGPASDTDVARVMTLLREDDEPAAATTAARGASFAWWRAAAALALTAALTWWVTQDPATPQLPDVLGDTIVLEDNSPHGGYASFTWTDVDVAGRRFHIFVYSGEDGSDVDDEQDWADTTWTPDSARTADWPDEIIVMVEARDITGATLGFSQELSSSR